MAHPNQILIYSPGLYPCKTGGLEIYNFHLMENIQKEYPAIDCLVFTGCKSIYSRDSNCFPLRNRLFILRRWGLGSISTCLYYLISRQVDFKNIKIVLIPYSPSFRWNVVPFLVLDRFFDVKYAIHIHDGDLSSIKTDRLQRLFFERAKRIAGVSLSIVTEYKKKFGVEVSFLPPLIPLRNLKIGKEELKKKFKLDKFDQIILFLGTLKPLKAPDVLLRAITMMDKSKLAENRVGFVIVGGGTMERELRSFCSTNELDHIVHFTGSIPYEDTAIYFSMADIFVIPSWHEGTSISLLEAMFNGLTCVGSKVPGITDVLEDGKNSILFQKNNSEELSKVLDQLVQDSNKQKSLGEAARRDVIQRFDYRDHLSEMMHFLLDE